MKKYLVPVVGLLFAAGCVSSGDNNRKPGSKDAVVVVESTGKRLFTGNCVQCHALKQDRTGPALAGVKARWGADTAKLIAFVHNSQQVIAADGPDSYSGKLFDKWYKTSMPSFSGLSDDDIRQILDYVDKGED